MHAFSSPAWDKEVQADFGTSRALMFNPTTDTELTGRRLQFEAQVRVQQASEGQVRLSDSLSTVDFPKKPCQCAPAQGLPGSCPSFLQLAELAEAFAQLKFQARPPFAARRGSSAPPPPPLKPFARRTTPSWRWHPSRRPECAAMQHMPAVPQAAALLREGRAGPTPHMAWTGVGGPTLRGGLYRTKAAVS